MKRVLTVAAFFVTDLNRRVRTVFFIAVVLATLLAGPAPAFAQQNPFIGTWSTGLTTPQGAYEAFLDFYPNGTMHLSGLVTSGGQPIHEWGSYQVDTAQSLLQYVFRAYEPILPGEPGPAGIGQPITTRYRFPNPNQFILIDGTIYIRQPGNPYPDPHR